MSFQSLCFLITPPRNIGILCLEALVLPSQKHCVNVGGKIYIDLFVTNDDTVIEKTYFWDDAIYRLRDTKRYIPWSSRMPNQRILAPTRWWQLMRLVWSLMLCTSTWLRSQQLSKTYISNISYWKQKI